MDEERIWDPARACRKPRLGAANETGLDPKKFPATCPYSLADITSRVFEYE